MKNHRRKLSIVLALVFLFIIGAGSSACAATTPKTVQAYSGVTIYYNGQQLTGAAQPFIINDTTYIPIRMLMEAMDNGIYWDSMNYRVIVTGSTASEAALAEKDATIASLEKKIARLEDQVDDLRGQDIDDIEETIGDYFEDAGDDYFDDNGIELKSFTLSGDEDDLAYRIKLDFDDADDYDELSDLGENDIEDFLDDVEDKIYDEIDDTDYEDADITGRLIDADDSSLYVDAEDGDYEYSWEDDVDLDDVEENLMDEYEDAGDEYFDDDGIEIKSLTLSGSSDTLSYVIKMDFSDADDYDDLSDVDEDDIEEFLDDFEDALENEIDGSSYEDNDILGKLRDYDYSSLYVTSEDGDYDFYL